MPGTQRADERAIFRSLSRDPNGRFGPAPVQVPELAGRRVDDASKDLTTVGLTLGTVSEREVTSNTVPMGTIVEQAVRPGADLGRGAPVDVVVGVLPMTTTPAVIDKTVGDAEAELARSGLLMGAIHLPPVSDKHAGTVVAQDPVADVKLRKGDRVAVTIAVRRPRKSRDRGLRSTGCTI